ncbi:MAG: glycoside hydrolase family 36 protein [Oliverpabstia sp.]
MEKLDVKKADDIQLAVETVKKENGIEVYKCIFSLNEKNEKTGYCELTWVFPYLDCAGVWHPNCGFDRSINADWDRYLKSMTACSAPIMTLFSEDGRNRFTIAVSETKDIIEFKAGVHEEDGTVLIQVKIPESYIAVTGEYELDILMDRRDIPFYESIAAVTKWWEKDCEIKPIEPVESTRDAVYSTWYSYHQNLTDAEIEKECEMASEIGFKTVILDDGWQTDDNNRGYAFCGDWQVSENRFPDFRGHIQKVHDMGMKYMIWYSVPFLGCKAEKWEEFKDKILYYADSMGAGVLDPRYPEVREYLVETYLRGLRQWNLDGFKLDFIDQIISVKDTPEYNEKMDIRGVQDALDRLMLQIYDTISSENPNVMIEFRQRYIGPNMRKYGNMFRVTDCPNSAIRNRVGIVDLRMLSGTTTVHSDPLMWHPKEKPELAAIQIISSIFATVQISVKLEDSTEEMKDMLRFWVEFMSVHKDVLQKTQLRPQEPHNLYPVVWAVGETEAIGAVYTMKRIISLPKEVDNHIILNGTKGTEILIELEEGHNYEVVVKNCTGQTVETRTYEGKAHMVLVSVPVAGQIYVVRK